MNILHRRPLASVCVFLIVFFILTACLPFAVIGSLLGSLLLSAIILLLSKQKVPALWLTVAAVALLVAMLVHTFTFIVPQKEVESFSGKTLTLEGRVVDTTVYDKGQSLLVRLTAIDDEASDLRISLYTVNEEIKIGDVIRCKGEIYPLSNQDDEQLYQKASGIVAVVEIDGYVNVIKHTFSLRYLFRELNNTLADQLGTVTNEKSSGLFPALLLGNKSHLSSYTALLFRRAGASHLLALSGLHLSVLLAFLQKLLSPLRTSKRLKDALCLCFILVFTALSGASSSILRAAFMSSFYFIAWFFKRKNDSVTSLFFTAALLLLFWRGTLYDVGFWLSFFATYGIILSSKLPIFKSIRQENNTKLNTALRIIVKAKGILKLFFVTVFAVLFTLPLCALFFGEVSLLSIPSSLILSPFANIILLLALPLLLLSYVPYIGVWFGHIASIISNIFLRVVTWLGEISNTTYATNFLLVEILAVLLLLSLVAITLLPKKFSKILSLGSAFVFVTLIFSTAIGNIQANMKNEISYQANENHEFFLLEERGSAVLVDVSSGQYDASLHALSCLEEKHLTSLDTLVLTHLHQGHRKFLERMAKGIKIETLYLAAPLTEDEDAIYLDLLEIADTYHISCETYLPKEAVTLGKSTLYFHQTPVLPGETYPAFMVSVSREEETIVLLSSSYTYLKPPDTSLQLLFSAQTLILSAHGGNSENQGVLPVSDTTRRLILPNEKLSFGISEDIIQYLQQISIEKETALQLSFPRV